MPDDSFFEDGIEAASSTRLTPTAAEPLRGLEALSKVAVVGGKRIIELANAPIHYVWTDIAVAGIIVLLAGGPGEGKTTLLFLIIIARVNRGGPVKLLGRMVEPAPPNTYFVLIEGEHGEGSASRKLVSSCEIMGVEVEPALNHVILIARKAVRLGSPEWIDIQRMIAAGLVSDIAIDTVARVAPGDADNEREQVAIFDLVAQAIEAAPPDVAKPVAWAIAHTRKNGTTGDLSDVSGSTQRTGQADTVLLVKGEKEDGRVVSSTVTFAKLREEPDEYPLPVTFAIRKDGDGKRSIAASDKKADDDRPLEVRILDRLALGPRTKNRLASDLGRSKADVDEALSLLFADKRLSTTMVTVRGREFKAFTLRQNDTGRTRDSMGTPDVTGRDGTESWED